MPIRRASRRAVSLVAMIYLPSVRSAKTLPSTASIRLASDVDTNDAHA